MKRKISTETVKSGSAQEAVEKLPPIFKALHTFVNPTTDLGSAYDSAAPKKKAKRSKKKAVERPRTPV